MNKCVNVPRHGLVRREDLVVGDEDGLPLLLAHVDPVHVDEVFVPGSAPDGVKVVSLFVHDHRLAVESFRKLVEDTGGLGNELFCYIPNPAINSRAMAWLGFFS